MKRKVKIKALPAAQSGLEVKMAGLRSGLGFNSNALPWGKQVGEFSKPDIEVNSTLGPVPRHQANLEAEEGEVAMLPGKGGIPSTFKIGGNKHYDGGTPLNLPPDSFIYSDTKAMKIKDPEILKQFGMPAKTSGFTPADIAKKYDINAYKKVLADPDSDDLQRETAEGMIANYNLKLAKLALLQESKKGFPQGLPMVAMPYLEALQIDPSEFVQSPAMGEQPGPDNMQMSKYGGNIDYFQEGGFKPTVSDKPPVSFPKAFQTIVETLSDPGIQDAIYKNYMDEAKRIKDPELRTKALATNKEKVLSNLLQMQKQNYAIASAKTDLSDERDIWDKTTVADKSGKKWAKNEKYKTVMQELGFAPDQILNTDEDIAIAQAAYNATLKTSQSPEHKKKFALLEPLTGKSDETYDPSRKNISAPDTWYGNTTAGQLLKYKGEIPAEVVQADPAKPGEAPVVTQVSHLEEPHVQQGSPWWLQDIIKTAHAAGNLMRVKKYEPWQATADVVRPRVAFFDPNRELAANAEQSNIAAQTLAQFTGPQSFNARYNEVQGKGLTRAADTISRVHNQNVDMSNRQEALNADMMNRASEQRAHQATSLWDKYQIANQQFDNAKSQARDALVNQYVNAITNKNYTANLNKLYPQFAVNPAIGGEYYFHDPRALKPDFSQAPDLGQLYEDVLTKHPHLKETPGGDKIALDIAKQQAGLPPSDPYLDYQNKGVIPQYYPGFNQEE